MKAKARATVQFLIDSWVEKGCVFGDEAKEDQKKIADMIDDLVGFWALDDDVSDLLEQFKVIQSVTTN
ncbi:hypothetical protein ACIFOE_23425 [Paenibacillus sp. NRS-1783]|uniref:hypothetical protein n=1 Tax=Paenibacillus sp. NRS-1783 TaxID=3233907 RepID=UPI003D2CBD8E